MNIVKLFIVHFATASSKVPSSPIERPQLVQDALKNNKPIYYFGLGSNMSRKKIENRGINGIKIEIMKMEPAVVPNYRLAFNMKGFPPLEPGMGSLEPIDSDSTRILSYEHPECHEALVKLSPENYEKVMRSEGVGNANNTEQGYEEIVVQAYPYGNGDGLEKKGKPIPAVALRARARTRLKFDPCPSERYMKILKEGAEELKLVPCYQEFLNRIPVQRLTKWQRKQAIYNFVFTTILSMVLKTRIFSKIQRSLLFLVYTPASSQAIARLISELLTSAILMPGAVAGFFIFQILELTGKTPSQLTRFLSFLSPKD